MPFSPPPQLPPVLHLPSVSVPATPAAPAVPSLPSSSPAEVPNSTAPPLFGQVLELTADHQDYDAAQHIFTAYGHVVMRIGQTLLQADRIQVNTENHVAVATGNVSLTQGQRLLRGNEIEYDFVKGTGVITKAWGEVNLRPTPAPAGAQTLYPSSPVGPGEDQVLRSQPLVPTQDSSLSLVFGFGRSLAGLSNAGSFLPPAGGVVKHLRYEADRIEFTPESWEATNLRLTNDPFSPPETELRAKRAEFKPLSPFEDELITHNPRLVLDQKIVLPLYPSRFTLGRNRHTPSLPFLIGYDGPERGGLYLYRPITVLANSRINWQISPEFYIQQAFASENFQKRLGIVPPAPAVGNPIPNTSGLFHWANYGVHSTLSATFTPQDTLSGYLLLSGLDLQNVQNNLYASLRLHHSFGPDRLQYACSSAACGATRDLGNYAFEAEYSYRNLLFNGSLGFQTVQQSIGGVFTSPLFPIGKPSSNLLFSYQVGAQYVEAATDRQNLLPPGAVNNLVFLGRTQASAFLTWTHSLWYGKALPLTATEALRFSPTPVVPNVGLFATATGVISYYTSGDTQNSLTGTLGLQVQIGHFKRLLLDYTNLTFSYTQVAFSGQSPFLFDRIADQRYVYFSITQQILGPLLVGFDTEIDLPSGNRISSDYIIDFQRRTYSVIIRYNPVQQIGSINLLINDFNWNGGTTPFSGEPTGREGRAPQ